ncbi:MAG: ABC transporter permease [Dehalococcoidia bacterium]
MLKYSILNAFRRKVIAIIAILGTALGVALMTVLLSISDGMDAMMTSTMNEMAGWIQVYPESAPMGSMLPSPVGFPISYADEIKQIDNVNGDATSASIMGFVATEVADFGDPMGIYCWGVDRDAEMTGSTLEDNNPFENIIEGRAPEIGQDEVILGSMAAALGKSKGGDYTEIGGKINIPIGNISVTLTVVGIFETENMLYDTSIYTDIDTARKLMPLLAADEANYIHVEVTDIKYVQEVSEQIQELFADREVPVTASVATDMIESFSDMMDTLRSFLWIVSLVAAVAGGFSIFIVMLISVMERTKEFGILKASGWSNFNIISSVVIQSITVGLLGAAVGLLIGYGVLQAINVYMNGDIGIITWRLAFIVLSFGIIMGVIGGLYPAIRAARVSPIESMRSL